MKRSEILAPLVLEPLSSPGDRRNLARTGRWVGAPELIPLCRDRVQGSESAMTVGAFQGGERHAGADHRHVGIRRSSERPGLQPKTIWARLGSNRLHSDALA